MDTKEINLLLSLRLADKQKAKEAEDHLRELDLLAKKLSNDAEELRKRLALSLVRPAGQTDDINSQLKGIEDELKKVTIEAEKAKSQLEETVYAIDKTQSNKHLQEQSAYNFRDIGEKINQIGSAVANAGMGINNMLMGSVNTYLATATAYDQSAVRWNAAQREMQDSYARIGGIATKELLPLVESVSRLTKEMADYAEQNPEVVGGAIIVGTGLLVVGKTVQMIGGIAMLVGSIDTLIKLPFFASALSAAAAPAVVGTELAVGGTELAVGGTSLGAMAIAAAPYVIATLLAVGALALMWKISQDVVAERKGKGGTYITGGYYIPGPKERQGKSEETTLVQKEYNAALEAEMIIKRQAAADAREKGAAEEAQLRTRDQNSRLQTETDNLQTINNIEENYAKERVSIEANSAKQRSSIMEGLAAEMAQAEQNYLSQRKQITRDGSQQIRRIEEDSQKRLLQLRQEHDGRVTDLVASRDAYGLEKENRDYESKKNEEINNTNTEIKRRREDITLRLKDLDESYRREQLQRQQAANARLQQIDAEETAALNLLKKKQEEELKLQAHHYAQLLKALVDEFNKQLVAIRKASGFYNPPVTGHKANGGTVLDGMTYLVGERGPELFTAPRNGEIVPAGLTADILNPRARGQSGPRNMTLKIESSSLTMTEILYEVDKRFQRYDNGLQSIFAQ